jgi:hypothetical protein
MDMLLRRLELFSLSLFQLGRFGGHFFRTNADARRVAAGAQFRSLLFCSPEIRTAARISAAALLWKLNLSSYIKFFSFVSAQRAAVQ